MNYKNISYLISHIFLMLFIYLFLVHRYSRAKTVGICFCSFLTLCLTDCLKLNLFPDSGFCYAGVTIFQILVTQATGPMISKKRDSKVLFIGLSASNYVIAGSVTATILYIWTGKLLPTLAGSIAVHLGLLLLLYNRIRDIWFKYQERESMRSWWELCLIPCFFYCGISSLAYFPYTLDEHPFNTTGVILFIMTMFISYVVVLRYVESESGRAEIYWKNVMFESYIKGLENQYFLVEQAEKNLRILRHDMRHYSVMISALLEQGAYDEIKKVADHICTVADENKVEKYCGNLIVNTMFSCMMEKADALAVKVCRDIFLPGEIPVNEYEFALVVANLLENAIDCVKELPSAQRTVDVTIRCVQDHLLVHIKNAYDKEIVFDTSTGLPKSAKGVNHGLGMQSVQAFSDKIGGSIGCYCENHVFHIMVFAKF